MKKILAVALCSLTVLTMIGCEQEQKEVSPKIEETAEEGTDDTSENSTQSTEQESTENEKLIDYIDCSEFDSEDKIIENYSSDVLLNNLFVENADEVVEANDNSSSVYLNSDTSIDDNYLGLLSVDEKEFEGKTIREAIEANKYILELGGDATKMVYSAADAVEYPSSNYDFTEYGKNGLYKVPSSVYQLKNREVSGEVSGAYMLVYDYVDYKVIVGVLSLGESTSGKELDLGNMAKVDFVMYVGNDYFDTYTEEWEKVK